jgi:RNA polymerase sigma factor (sigma-70 family)
VDDSSPKAPAFRTAAEAAVRPRVLIADDQTILREGLRAMLEADASLELVGAADDGLAAMRSVGALKPDVVVVDLSLPGMDGLAAIREIKRRSAGTRTLILTAHKSAEYIGAALRAGADGYLLKQPSRAELLMAIDSVMRGKPFISPAVSQDLVKKYLEQNVEHARVPAAMSQLSARETQVLKLVAEGERNRQIAERLAISVKTVEKHRSNLMRKLQLHNTAALTSFAIENRLIGRMPSRIFSRKAR